MSVYQIASWESIFLDTSIILRMLRGLMPDCTDEESIFATKILRWLSENNADSGRRHFYISSITIAEIWRKTTASKAQIIIDALKTEDVTFVPFDNDVAEYLNENFSSILSRNELNKFARENSWPEHDLVNAREWISKDFMIVASSAFYDSDVLLTCDKNTMIPICDKFNLPSAFGESRCYDYNDSYFFTYDRSKIQKKVS